MHLVLHEGAPGEIYNIGAGQRDPQPGARRQAPRAARARTSRRSSTSRTGSATTAATPSTSPRSPTSAGRKQRTLDEALEATVAWYRANDWWWRPLKAGGVTVRVLDHRRGRPARPRPRARRAPRPATRSSPATAPTLDLGDRDSVAQAITGTAPDVVVNAGAWTAVDDCEADPDRAWRINALGVRWVADAARRVGAHVVHVSTDYVFDGTKAEPYVEWDRPEPAVGLRPLEAGRASTEVDPASTIVRTAWVCGAHGSNMVKTVLAPGATARSWPSWTTSGAAPPSPPTWRRRSGAWPSARLPGTFHVTNQGDDHLVRLRPGHPRGWRATTRTRCARSPPRSSIRPARRPARPTRCSTTPPCGLAGLPLLPHYRESLDRLLRRS